jgi:anti-sigma regulatory factor (Ser/Thr protein kinase)
MSTLVLSATLASVPLLLEHVQHMAEEAGLDEAERLDILLAAEEMLVNVVSYAYPDCAGNVRVDAEVLEGGHGLRLRIVDQGVAFNPLERPEPDTSIPLEERALGGLGIMLTRRKTDCLCYERAGASNVLVMEKHRRRAGAGQA